MSLREEYNEIEYALDRFGKETVAKMILALRQGGKGDSRFIRLINSYVNVELLEFQLYIEMPSYGEFIDKGRRAGARMPPRQPIMDWMQRKAIPLDKEYPIRKSISVRGIRPVPFLNIWFDRVLDLNDELEIAAFKDITKIVEKYSKKYNN